MMNDLPNPVDLIKLAEPDNLDVAARLAREKLGALDPAVVAARCGAGIVDGGLELVYLGTTLHVRLPGWLIHYAGGPELNPYEQVLVLHYLASSDPVPPPDDPITFTEVPSGEFYGSAFDRRAKIPLLAAFGEDPERAIACAAPYGGTRAEHGDLAVSVRALPNVKIILVFWKGDNEFPPDVKLLLSSSIASFLSTEDIAHLAGLTASRIIKESRR
ncbi:MAG: DUF3786 domain-containing protein [Deltaproteobacteria bacterium]|nr:DUF3786 domain-containing protein [Deltaproteobacteria bacterium]